MAAKRLQISVEEAHRRYEALTERFQLRLVWRMSERTSDDESGMPQRAETGSR